MVKIVDGKLFAQLVKNGYENLKLDKDYINELNVFPIPDGDTGTNMLATLEGGVNITSSLDERDISKVSKLMARNMLMTARGNSGVITSQIFKGIANGLTNKTEVNAKEFAFAFTMGTKQAYAVCKNPTEGTILTVIREAGEKAYNSINENSSVEEFFKYYLLEAKASLKRTPDLLPCLKEAGVVDSGAAGFIRIVEGMNMFLLGHIVTNEDASSKNNEEFNEDSTFESDYTFKASLQLLKVKCNIAKFDIDLVKKSISDYGEISSCSLDQTIVTISMNTKFPGKVINLLQKYGEFISLDIKNEMISSLPVQKEEIKKVEHKEVAIVATSLGQGISEVLEELGVDEIVTGGQTMNPSTEDFLKAFKRLNADTIIVFPNNSNIFMAASLAAREYNDSKVIVLNSKSVATCYSCMSMYDLSDGVDNLINTFNEIIENGNYGEITYSIRDSEINGVLIKKGQYISILNHNIVASSDDKIVAFKELLSHVTDIKNKDVLVLIYGKDVKEKQKEEVRNFLSTTYPRLEYGEIDGGQDIYDFIISIE